MIQLNHMQNRFKIIDESGDHKYFTIIPNYIVNHSTVYEQAIYLYMKRVAGESGTCWTSAQEIAKHLNCSRNTIAKYRDKLLQRGWVEVIGKKGKTKPTCEYRIVDLWKLNTDYYVKNHTKKDSSSGEQSQKIVHVVNLESSRVGHKEEPIKKNNTILRTAKTPSAHKLFIDFWYNEVQRARHIKPIITGKDGKNLKRIIESGIAPATLEQLAVYFLNHWSFKGFAPSISTFLSAGVLNGIQNRMANRDEFWKELDGFAARVGLNAMREGFGEQLARLKAGIGVMISPRECTAISEEVASAERAGR